MDNITHVVFDIGNVILRSTHGISFEILMELGVRRDLTARFFGEPYERFSLGNIKDDDFVERVRQSLEAPWLTREQIRAAVKAHVYMRDFEVDEILEELHRREVQLGFATNTNPWQFERQEELVHLRRLGFIARSDKIGNFKQGRGGWTSFLRVLGVLEKVAPTSILVVDDSTSSIEAAQEFGLQAYKFNPDVRVGARELRGELVRRALLR